MNGIDCSSSKISWSSFQRITADSQEDDASALATSKNKEGTRVGDITIFLWLLLYHYFPNLPPTCAWHWKLTSAERCTGEEKLTTKACHIKSRVKNMKCDRGRTQLHRSGFEGGDPHLFTVPPSTAAHLPICDATVAFICVTTRTWKNAVHGVKWRGHKYEDIYKYICTNIWHVALMMRNERGRCE